MKSGSMKRSGKGLYIVKNKGTIHLIKQGANSKVLNTFYLKLSNSEKMPTIKIIGAIDLLKKKICLTNGL
ncbi:hypothetical protein C5S39_05395 [Candidatus Methanophagaceae archaeon]|jgi:hypothetical protein|nr:hypothetical protein C5S39_05395 [Methanophagales archaeon]OEU63329.1 MAG: hypothetical protein BA867_13250 [Desulfobacterales bacterium S5133MH16]